MSGFGSSAPPSTTSTEPPVQVVISADPNAAAAYGRLKLVRQAPVKLQPNFDPSALAAWFHPTSGVVTSSVVLGGLTTTAISQWTDASGNGRHAVQATDELKPRVSTFPGTAFAGVECGWRDYDGVAWRSSKLVIPAISAGAQTVFIVCKRNVSAHDRGVALMNSDVYLGPPLQFSSGAKYARVQFNGGTERNNRFEALSAETETCVLGMSWHGKLHGTAAWRAYTRSVNGVQQQCLRAVPTGGSPSAPIDPTFTAATYIGGNISGGNQDINGHIAEVIIFNRTLTTAEHQGIQNYLCDKYSAVVTRQPSKTSLLADGDSIVDGYNGSWFYEMTNALDVASPLNSKFTARNAARGGDSLPNMISQAPTEVDTFGDPNASRNILLVKSLTNDLGPRTVAETYEDLVQYCTDRRLAGFEVVVMTTMTAALSVVPDPWEARRVEINAMIVDQWRTFADYMIDVGSYPDFTRVNSTTVTNMDDGIHPNPAGNAILATKIAADLRKYIGW